MKNKGITYKNCNPKRLPTGVSLIKALKKAFEFNELKYSK
tara:strand:- start:56 stop:175 length:120 start_codon:yes stop_codon:yes gene_type:complete